MSHLLKYLSDLPRSVKAVFLLVVDSVVLGFSMLLAFAVRFDPASLEHQLRILSEAIWAFIAVQRAGTVFRWMVPLPALWRMQH